MNISILAVGGLVMNVNNRFNLVNLKPNRVGVPTTFESDWCPSGLEPVSRTAS